MKNSFIPRLSFEAPIEFKTGLTGHVQKTGFAPGPEKASFQDTLANTLGKVNETLNQPDALMHEAMTVGSVDVHDVMIANAKAELAVNITTSITTKVIQAYDKIMQIQI